jgi:hypothetical protein
MMTFLRILIFAKIVLLTPEPIDLFGEVELKLRESLTAITKGASIEINISSLITKPRQEGILEFRRRLREVFPPGTIEATMISKDKRQVTLHYNGASAYSGNEVILILDADGGVPTDVEFEKLIITSRINLKSVTVSWKNYKY